MLITSLNVVFPTLGAFCLKFNLHPTLLSKSSLLVPPLCRCRAVSRVITILDNPIPERAIENILSPEETGIKRIDVAMEYNYCRSFCLVMLLLLVLSHLTSSNRLLFGDMAHKYETAQYTGDVHCGGFTGQAVSTEDDPGVFSVTVDWKVWGFQCTDWAVYDCTNGPACQMDDDKSGTDCGTGKLPSRVFITKVKGGCLKVTANTFLCKGTGILCM
jgi:hypothetical protein